MSSPLHSTFTGEIPENYDRLLGPAWFGPAGKELVKRVPADPGGDVLEIACGTGLVTRELRRKLDPSRRLVATDLNKPMLDYASGKLADLRGIEWREADAMSLPFPDARFGAVACGLGLMFVPDKKKAVAEMRRVAKPGATLVISTWAALEENSYAHLYAQTIEHLFPGDEEIRFRMPWSLNSEAVIRELLESGGLGDIQVEKIRFAVGGDPRSIATGQVKGTPRGLILEKKGLSMDEAIERVTRAIEQMREPGHATMLVTRARA